MKKRNPLSIRRPLLLLGANLAALVGLFWLLRLPVRNYEVFDWIGYVCVVLCLSGLFTFLISSYWLGFGVKHEWSPAYCHKQGFWLSLYLTILFVNLGHARIWLAAPLGLSIGVLAGLILRKRMYPTLADEQLYSSKRLPRIFPL